MDLGRILADIRLTTISSSARIGSTAQCPNIRCVAMTAPTHVLPVDNAAKKEGMKNPNPFALFTKFSISQSHIRLVHRC
jgi:hypothetical protein